MERKPFNETHPHLNDFMNFLEVFNGESDRGAALISMAMLDDLLERTISAFLIENQESSRLLEGFNAPLGTLSTRILAAHCLGLISEREFKECERLRKVRNEFAHNIHQTFDDQKVRDICATLTYSIKKVPGEKISPKLRFNSAAVSLILNLTNRPAYVSKKRLKFEEWPY